MGRIDEEVSVTADEPAATDRPEGADLVGADRAAFSWQLEGDATDGTAPVPPVPRPGRVWIAYAIGLVAGAAVGFFGYPVVVGSNLRHAGEAITWVAFAAGFCAVAGLAVGIALDAAAMRRAERPVGGLSPVVWALAVVVLAVVAAPVYLFLRAKAPPTSRPTEAPSGNPVLGAVLGVVAVVVASAVATLALLAAPAVFGVAIDPAKVEQAIDRGTTNSSLASLGVPNVSCSIPGLLRVGDTFSCTQRLGDPFGLPPIGPTTTDLLGGLGGGTTATSVSYTVTVTDEAGTVTWRRTS